MPFTGTTAVSSTSVTVGSTTGAWAPAGPRRRRVLDRCREGAASEQYKQQECTPARLQGVGPAFEGDAPEVVHRVLGSEEDAHSGPERGGEAEDERERAAVQRAVAELWPDHGELAER